MKHSLGLALISVLTACSISSTLSSTRTTAGASSGTTSTGGDTGGNATSAGTTTPGNGGPGDTNGSDEGTDAGQGGNAAGGTNGASGTIVPIDPATMALSPEVASGNPACTLPSFPGAEGFGACAEGGRGGQVLYVTNLNPDGEGSLQAALDEEGPRYILFKVSGVIDASVTVRGHGKVTLAGQTSPGGIIVKGLLIENAYEDNDAHDIIIRHIRSRQGQEGDGLRIGAAHDVIVDHGSFENNSDEQIEISRSRNVTVQRSILGEQIGNHDYSGLLINYSTTLAPLDNLSIHHNAWIRVTGRYPEISCEENSDGPGGGAASNCHGVTRHYEIANNVVFDPTRDGIVYNPCTGTNQTNNCSLTNSNSWWLNLNFIANIMRVRTAQERVEQMFGDGNAQFGAGSNAIHYTDNRFIKGSTDDGAPSIASHAAFAFPTVHYTAIDALEANLQATVGARPADAMDRRLTGYLGVDINSAAYTPYVPANDDGASPDVFTQFASVPAAFADGDNDGMPDAFETAHGLDPAVANANGTELSAGGYTNLEVYLNSLADALL